MDLIIVVRRFRQRRHISQQEAQLGYRYVRINQWLLINHVMN